MKGYGDRLARGGVRASFGPAGGNMTQKQWDEMFEPEKPEPEKKVKNQKKTN